MTTMEQHVGQEATQSQLIGRVILALAGMCPIIGLLFVVASSYSSVATKLDASQAALREFRTETKAALEKLERKIEGLDGRQWDAAQVRMQLLSRMQELERRMERQDSAKSPGGG